MHCPALISMLFYVCCFALQFNDLFGTARKNMPHASNMPQIVDFFQF